MDKIHTFLLNSAVYY